MRLKVYVFIFYLLVPLFLRAQSHLSNMLIVDPAKKVVKMVNRTRGVIGTIGWLLNDLDSAYVKPNHYNYALMVENSNWYEYYQFKNNEKHNEHLQQMVFMPDPHYKLGGYIGWSFLFLGWSMDMEELFHNKKNVNSQSEFELNVYSAIVGADIYYRKSGNSFTLQNLKGFGPFDNEKFKDVNALNVNIRGINAYWVFNHRHFSYPAAYSQSTEQIRSAGSLIAGFSYSRHKFDLDSKKLPDSIQSRITNSINFNQIRYSDYSLSLGYAYNWVIIPHLLNSISVAPAIAYKITSTETNSQPIPTIKRMNFDAVGRYGLVWNNGLYYIGTSLVVNTYTYKNNNFKMNNAFGTWRIYAGFNFGKKQKYKK